MKIELSKEEAIEIIKHLSRIEGYLMGTNAPIEIHEQLDYAVDLLTNKIYEKNEQR